MASKRAERIESITVEQDSRGVWGIYQVTRFPMSGKRSRHLIATGGRLIALESAARGVAADRGLKFHEVE